MAFWRRIKQSKIDAKLWNQLTRSYLQIQSPVSANRTKISVLLNEPILPSQRPQFDLPSNVRFFAAPVQFTQKKEVKDTSGPRLNERITADVVRLVTEEGHSVVSKHEALRIARSLKVDLVEVQRNAKPPVCKLMEYKRAKYKQELMEKDRAKKKSEGTLRKGACKEVRFAAKITQNDLQIKADMVKRLMESGYRVKCVAIGNANKGEDSATLLSRFSALIEDSSVVESNTRVEEKDQAHVILRHVKYGPLKKGSAKKASRDSKAAAANVEEMENDDDVEEKENLGWTISDANDDFDKVFDVSETTGEVSKGLRSEKLSIARETLSSLEGGSSHYASRSGGKDTLQSGSQFSDVVSRPQVNLNASPQRRETEGVNDKFSASKTSKLPEQGLPSNIPDIPAPSYGIFSGRQGNNPQGKQNIPGEVNRYKQTNASNSSRNYGPSRPQGHQNGPMSNYKIGRDQAFNRDGQGRWGVYSGECTEHDTKQETRRPT